MANNNKSSQASITVKGAHRFLLDCQGNILPLAAAAVLPLMGLIGASVDMSRAYLVKSRLQNACDAGALAGRRTIKGGTWTPEAQAAAASYFSANFPAGRYGTKDLTSSYEAGTDLVVKGHATVKVPTAIMQLFGKTEFELEAKCDAEMQVPNSDVMFVLDTTGSMADINPGDTVSRIAALRTAVTNFYTSLENARSSAAQVRYGFVPYATTVNVGYLLKREWMVDRWTYQSRIPDGTTTSTTETTSTSSSSTSGWTTLSGSATNYVSYLPLEDCAAPANTSSYTDSTTSSTVDNPDGSRTTTVTRTRTTNGSNYSVSISSSQCRLTETRYSNYVQRRTETTTTGLPPTTTTRTTTNYRWLYKPVEYDVSSLKGAKADGTMAGGSIVAPVANNHANRTVTWNGCIEERDTVRTSSYDPIPSDAYDLDVDRVPSASDPRTQWRPAMGQLVFARKSITNWYYPEFSTTSNYTNIGDYMSGFYAACPSAARKLTAISPSALSTYLSGLKVSGNTYHDIGFLWGLRLLSATGLFASENATAPNGGSISRHLIFMTDGATDTDRLNYEAYGLSALDRRRTSTGSLPTNAEQNTIVEQRLAALCRDAKNRNITVWVIAFGTSLTSLLEECASNGRAFEASNAAELNDTFAKIAAQISQLRLTR